jgi:hypothetical protein
VEEWLSWERRRRATYSPAEECRAAPESWRGRCRGGRCRLPPNDVTALCECQYESLIVLSDCLDEQAMISSREAFGCLGLFY